jgi:glycogen synthase
MKVLLLGPYPPPHGGVQTNLVAIRSFLRKRGISCAVINITRHRKPEADEIYYPKGALQTIQLLQRLPHDVIHLHIGGMLTNRVLALALVCTLRPKAKSVMTFHSGGFPSTPEGQSLGPSSFAGLVLRRFDGLIGVNEEIMAFFRKMKVTTGRARLISPFATVSYETSTSLPEPLAGFFRTHNPVLISVGLLEPEYDLPIQIDAMPRVRQKFPEAGLLLIGSGSIEAHLRARIQANSCAPHILLTGDVPHAATMQAISRSQLMLRTTLYDGDALSVREALQLGTPVIATDNAMRPAGVRLIAKSNSAQLLQVIEQELTLQPERRQPLSVSDESNLQAVLNLYQELMNEN